MTDNQVLLANTPVQVECLLLGLEKAARRIMLDMKQNSYLLFIKQQVYKISRPSHTLWQQYHIY